jgi:hypothetical protein
MRRPISGQRHRDLCIPRFELRNVTTSPPGGGVEAFLSERPFRGGKSGNGVFQTFPPVTLDKKVAADFVGSRGQPASKEGRCKSPSDQSLKIPCNPECTQAKNSCSIRLTPWPQASRPEPPHPVGNLD